MKAVPCESLEPKAVDDPAASPLVFFCIVPRRDR
ncbi:MAG: hypothetical protein H6P95_950 [Candidatus Aminicenantes bacterium]|nr:hypothetical protein [Candidatus Aminicenantes bacterium]